MKKAQTSEIFFFILAIIVIGLLLLFGVKYILELGTKMNQIDLVQFKSTLEGYADEARPVYGRWTKYEITVPTGIEKVCFIQHELFGEGLPPLTPVVIQQQGLCKQGHADYNFLMCQEWQSNTTGNVYTDPFQQLETGIDLGPIEVDSDDASAYYLCMDTSSHTLKIKMTGKGDRTLLEEW